MKTIIFDFGNVVGFFDHGRTLERLVAHTRMRPEAMFDAIYNGDLEDIFESGRISRANFLGEVKKLCGLSCDLRFLDRAFTDIFEPNPEVCGLIENLKPRYRILLGSNTNELHAEHFMTQFEGVLSHFHHLVLSYRIRVRKPHAGFYEHCVAQAGCRAHECLFIDDLPPNIAGAEAAGLRGLLYRPGQNLVARLRALGISV